MDRDHQDTPNRQEPSQDSLEQYRIRVRGHLGARWSSHFEGMALTPNPDGSTLIEGVLPDQAALHAVLRQLRDLGLELLSVSRGPPS